MSAHSAELRPHPSSPSDAIHRLDAEIELSAHPSDWRVRFRVEATPGRLRLPLPGSERRRDGLWQHTCFEAFLRPDASDIYYEFNFAPSLEWAAYRFESRRGERRSPDLPAPPIRFQQTASGCELIAELPVAALPELASAPAVRVGLAAVIEREDGSLSWWALAHAGEQPDFHDPATFVLCVKPA